jgi:hypothetical protein
MSMQEQSQQTGQEDMQDQAGFARDQQAMDPEAERRQDQMQSQTQTEQQDERSSMNQPLLSAGDGETFKQRWEQIQVTFVDEPQTSVREADALVQELMQRLADSFAQERSSLEEQWARGEEASTEDLRTALQQYRSFFRRLLVA